MHDEPSDEPLESLLREHFAAELDPQLGRAPSSFEQHASEGVVERNPRWTMRRIGLLAGVTVALAASVMLAVVFRPPPQPLALPVPHHDAPSPAAKKQPESPRTDRIAEAPDPAIPSRSPNDEPEVRSSEAIAATTGPAKEDEPLLVKQGIEYCVLDSEVIQLDSGTPVRKLRRQRLEQREYLDPQQGARMKLFLPREEVRYESIPTQ